MLSKLACAVVVCSSAAAQTLTIATSSLPAGSVCVTGCAYSATLQATGGTSPYAWSITSGSLPPGLALTGSSITGTPITSPNVITPTVYNFIVQATDNASVTAQSSLAISVDYSPPLGQFLTTEAANVSYLPNQAPGMPENKVPLLCHHTFMNALYASSYPSLALWEKTVDGLLASGCGMIGVEISAAAYLTNDPTLVPNYLAVLGPGGYIRTHYPGVKILLNIEAWKSVINWCQSGSCPSTSNSGQSAAYCVEALSYPVVSDWTNCIAVTTYPWLNNETLHYHLTRTLQPDFFALVEEPTAIAGGWGQGPFPSIPQTAAPNTIPGDWTCATCFIPVTSAQIKAAARATGHNVLVGVSTNLGEMIPSSQVPQPFSTAFAVISPSIIDWVGADIFQLGCEPQPSGICQTGTNIYYFQQEHDLAKANGIPYFLIGQTNHPRWVENGNPAIEANAILGSGSALWDTTGVNEAWLMGTMRWAAGLGNVANVGFFDGVTILYQSPGLTWATTSAESPIYLASAAAAIMAGAPTPAFSAFGHNLTTNWFTTSLQGNAGLAGNVTAQ
jgi:Putative Ig domain